MSRRLGRRDARHAVPLYYFDPFARLGFDYAWRADDALDDGSKTTSLPNYLGAAAPLLAHGTGQPIKAAAAALGGRLAIDFDGDSAGAKGYGAVVLGAAPTACTLVSVGVVDATSTGMAAITDGGAVNTGVSQLMIGTAMRGRKVTTDANATLDPLPKACVMASVFDASGITHYMNRYTGVFAAQSGALVGTTVHVGTLATAGTFTHNGLWTTLGLALRAMLPSEVASTLRMLGRYYGVAIAP